MKDLNPETLPENMESQGQWIKEKMKEWQTQWHLFFDSDQKLTESGEFDRPKILPTHIADDDRLIFGFSRASTTTWRKCFELFPEGDKMLSRFSNYMSSVAHPLSYSTVSTKLNEIIKLIQEIGPKEEVDFSYTRIINRDSMEGLAELRSTDNITVLIERSLLQPIPQKDLLQTASSLFLTEPLVASAKNYYYVHDWVTAVMFGDPFDKLHSLLYELWIGGWQVLLDNKGVFLAQRKV